MKIQTSIPAIKVVALTGGNGGAKLAFGLANVVNPNKLTITVNTGDDDYFHGLKVCPDLDTVMYTLAALSNPKTGWGITGETFATLGMLQTYGSETWFQLGDRDMATHIQRTHLINQNWSLSAVTNHLCQALRVKPSIVPMSNQDFRTMLHTSEGILTFQDYFVRHQCKPIINDISFEATNEATIAPAFADSLRTADLVIIGPSNPIVSIGPILAVPKVRECLENFSGPIIAVSPLIGGIALKGPAAKMMAELGEEATCVGVAKRLVGICDHFIVDSIDKRDIPRIKQLGMNVIALDTVMDSDSKKIELANEILNLFISRVKA